MKFSIVIPARDEERTLGACLTSIREAARPYPGDVEVIVVLNRCTDRTEAVAAEYGAVVVREDAPNLSRIRNAGARRATGDILVTVDADSRMSPNMLEEVDRALATGRWVGGGVPIVAERLSLGIVLSGLLIAGICLLGYGIGSAGLFWCRRRDFEAIGGFDEARLMTEDVDFAVRLKALGRKTGRRYGTLWRTRLVSSCRKFDTFGDWVLLRRPSLLFRAFRGVDPALAERFFYGFPHGPVTGNRSCAPVPACGRQSQEEASMAKDPTAPRTRTPHRLAFTLATILLGVLIYGLLGFLMDDIASIPGPRYAAFEQARLPPDTLKALEAKDKEIARVGRQLREKESDQFINRDAAQNLEKTINHLLDKQRANLQQNIPVPDGEQRAYTESMNIYLDYQKREQDIAQDIARLTAQRSRLQEERRAAESRLDEVRDPVRAAYAKRLQHHRNLLGFFQLLILVPLLVGAFRVHRKLPETVFAPLAVAAGAAVAAQVVMVLYAWLPLHIFSYLAAMVAIAGLGKLMVDAMRFLRNPTEQARLRQYREAYERFFCPICNYPIRRGPMRYLFWTRLSLRRLVLPREEGAGQDPRYICPSCGTSLYEECSFCHFMRHSLLPYCEHCGEKKEIAPPQ